MKTATYPVVKKTQFPDGVVCGMEGCGQLIKPGYPYDEFAPKIENGFLIVNLICVYH